jgi:tetratricopeptide (TPR) repeat protein
VKRSISLSLFGLLTIWPAITSAELLAASDYRQSGNEHVYNLEYDQAIVDYEKLIQQNSGDTNAYNDLAGAQLYKELNRLGLLDSGALGRNNRFIRDARPPVDPRAEAQVRDTLDRGRRAAERLLAQNPRSELALFSLCTNYALRANYEFALEKTWFAALRSGSKARGYCDQVRKLNPGFIDAYLVLGAYEYVAGSLPLPVKLFAAIGGLHGSREKGIEYLSHVAQQGKYNRDAARVLLVVLYRREKRALAATRVLEGLLIQYPRNYLFATELAGLYSDAGQPGRAPPVLKSLMQRADQNTPGYRRLGAGEEIHPAVTPGGPAAVLPKVRLKAR